MELECKTTHLNCYDTVLDTTLYQEETLESIVPDACPDILRIVDTEAVVCLKSKEGGRNRPVRRPLRPRWRRRAPADDHQYPFYLLRRTRRPGEQLSADGRPPGPGGGCPQSEPQKSPHQSESGRRGPGIRPQDRQLLRRGGV